MTRHLRRRIRRGVVGVIVEQERLLVIRRSLHVSAPNKICFPGGGQERFETEEATVVRELNEELSLSVAPVSRLWQCISRSGVELAWWQVSVDGPVEPIPAPLEVAEFAWMGPEELELHPDLLESNREFLNAWRAGQFELKGLRAPW